MYPVDVVNEELMRAKKLQADTNHAKLHTVPLPEQQPLEEQISELGLAEA